ncbi:MAG: hypothetical protein ACRD0U_14325, partial [Acidimicrobiales bacterium]
MCLERADVADECLERLFGDRRDTLFAGDGRHEDPQPAFIVATVERLHGRADSLGAELDEADPGPRVAGQQPQHLGRG